MMYTLGGPDGRTPVVERDPMRWAQFMEHGGRSVALTGNEQLKVSTVFLGLDHGFGRVGRGPVLFETMVFGGRFDGNIERYSTWAEAEAGHRRHSAQVFGWALAEG